MSLLPRLVIVLNNWTKPHRTHNSKGKFLKWKYLPIWKGKVVIGSIILKTFCVGQSILVSYLALWSAAACSSGASEFQKQWGHNLPPPPMFWIGISNLPICWDHSQRPKNFRRPCCLSSCYKNLTEKWASSLVMKTIMRFDEIFSVAWIFRRGQIVCCVRMLCLIKNKVKDTTPS